MDLARHAGALLGDGAPEFGAADRAPHADEQDAVGEQTQIVALRHVANADERREEEMQRREQHQRRAEREPAVEVLALQAIAVREPDDREQIEQALRRQHAAE
jgi:hypothetical protein